VYFSFFSGEKKGKVPKERKAVMPPNTSAVEGFEAITRRSDGEGVLYFLFSGEKRKVPKKKAESVKLRLPGGDLEKSSVTGYRPSSSRHPHGAREKGLAAKEILRFDRFLVNGEKRNGECTSSSLPLEGEGGPPKVVDEVDRSFPF